MKGFTDGGGKIGAWFIAFIYGACVSCSSILCSIYSQYTLQDGDLIFIEMSCMS